MKKKEDGGLKAPQWVPKISDRYTAKKPLSEMTHDELLSYRSELIDKWKAHIEHKHQDAINSAIELINDLKNEAMRRKKNDQT